MWAIKAGLRRCVDGEHLSRPRIAACGFAQVGPSRTNGKTDKGRVAVRVDPQDGRPMLAGLQQCGSVWECPVCSLRIGAKRAEEIQQVVTAVGKERCLLWTLTIRHGAGDDLALTQGRLMRCWRALTKGAPWERFSQRIGIVGSIRAQELTHGANGWHPHIHTALILRRDVPTDRVFDLELSDGRKVTRYLPPDTRLPGGEPSGGIGWLIDRWKACVLEYLDPWVRCPGCKLDHTRAEWKKLRPVSTVVVRAERPAPTLYDADPCAFAAGVDCPEPSEPDLTGLPAQCSSTVRICHCGAECACWHASPRQGAHMPDDEHGCELRPLYDGSYLVKMGLQFTVDHVKGRGEHGRNPWQIAAALAEPAPRDPAERPGWQRNRRRDAFLWRSYCEAMRGQRKLTWSRGLRLAFGLADVDDASLAVDEEPGRDPVTVLELEDSTWAAVRRLTVRAEDYPGLAGLPVPAALLELAATGGYRACAALLRSMLSRDTARGIGPPE